MTFSGARALSSTSSVHPGGSPTGRDELSLDGIDYDMAGLKEFIVQDSKARGLLGIKLSCPVAMKRLRISKYLRGEE